MCVRIVYKKICRRAGSVGRFFYDEVNENVELYSAFDNATYGKAAYYYDERAQEVFREIGVSRNEWNGEVKNIIFEC